MGIVRKRGKYYHIRYELPGPGGKRRQVWRSCRDLTRGLSDAKARRVAEAELARIESEIRGCRHIEECRYTLAQFCVLYLEDCAKVGLSPATVETARNYIRRHINPAMGHCLLRAIRPLQVQQFYNSLELAPKTVRNIAAQLHRIFHQAVIWGFLATNPADRLTLPKLKRSTKRAATIEEIAKILGRIEHSRYRLPILVILETGMRRGEVLGLRWEDLEDWPDATLDLGVINVSRAIGYTKDLHAYGKETKNDAGARPVLISADLLRELREHRAKQARKASDCRDVFEDRGWMFPDDWGELAKPPQLGKEFSRLARSVGVDLTIHELRHTQVSVLVQAGLLNKSIADRLGHSVEVMDRVYTHIGADQQRHAVEVITALLDRARRLSETG